MRILESGGVEIPVRASNIARLFYTQEFGETLDGSLIKIKAEAAETAVITDLLQIIWAMNKAENMYCKKSTPTFSQWLERYRAFDVNDCAAELFEEIRQGFMYQSVKNDSNEKEDPKLPQLVITIALKMGMDLDGLNELTTQSLIDIFKLHAGEKSGKESRRFATPSEISGYYGK